jgi:oligosaccharide repeat unit polymerase
MTPDMKAEALEVHDDPAQKAQVRVPSDTEGSAGMARTFQVYVALYILLIGNLSTILQCLVFGLGQAAGYEFAVAMITGVFRDLLLIAALVTFSKHPSGILHPLILAVIVWPLLSSLPSVISELGGWTGLIAGVPVEPPAFKGLPGRSASSIWMAIAKYNGVQIAALLSTYFGFSMFAGRSALARPETSAYNLVALRAVMVSLTIISLIIFFSFVLARGGFNAHLTSLGAGRFRELAGDGVVIVAIRLGALAIFVWIAAIPSDIKSPLFLCALLIVIAAQFVSNGSRGSALLVPLVVALIWAIRRQRIPWKIAVLLLPLMFVSIGLLGAVRTSSWYRSTANETLASTGWSKSIALAQKEVASRLAISANVPVVERGLSIRDGPLFGRSYFAAISAFIPRIIWHDKPRAVGSLYAQIFLGKPRSGTSIPVSAEAEMYWNFGLPGLVLLSMIYGALLRRMYIYYWRRYSSPFATVLYVLFITSFQFSSDRLVNFEQQAFLLFLCYLVAALFSFGASGSGFAEERGRATLQARRFVSDQHP